MSVKKILSLAASTIRLFIIILLFTSNSNAEEKNIKYYSDDMGILSLMYHRFDEKKYPLIFYCIELCLRICQTSLSNNLVNKNKAFCS